MDFNSMRDYDEWLTIANQKTRKEVWQSFVRRTMPYSEGVCMALAIAFIVRNARHLPTIRKAERVKLSGMTDRELKKINEFFEDLDSESFRNLTGNTFGRPPQAMLDSKNANFLDAIKKFNQDADSVDYDIQQKHFRVNAIQNATSGHIKKLGDDDDAKVKGIAHQIWNLTGMKGTKEAPSHNENGDRFWYVSDDGHGWAAVSRPAHSKFKLYDPNYGIVWFNTHKDLANAVKLYAGQQPRYLCFSATTTTPDF